jgi:hypothetical protein
MLRRFKDRIDGLIPLPSDIWDVRSDVLAMRAVVESRKGIRNREEVLRTLKELSDICDNFYRLTTGLMHNMKGKAFTQMATVWDMATVGSLAIHDLMGGKWKQIQDLLASAFSEGSMLMASLQYIKAASETLKASTDEHGSYLYGQLWEIVCTLRKDLTPAEAREAQKGLDDFFKGLSSEDTPLETRMIVLIQTYMILLKIKAGMLVALLDDKVVRLDE